MPTRSISARPICSRPGDVRDPRGAEKPPGRNPVLPATPSADRPRRVPIAPCQLSKGLKTLKTARGSYWLELASSWDRRHVRSGSAPRCDSVPVASRSKLGQAALGRSRKRCRPFATKNARKTARTDAAVFRAAGDFRERDRPREEITLRHSDLREVPQIGEFLGGFDAFDHDLGAQRRAYRFDRAQQTLVARPSIDANDERAVDLDLVRSDVGEGRQR